MVHGIKRMDGPGSSDRNNGCSDLAPEHAPSQAITAIFGGLIESYYRSNHKIYKINEAIAPVIRKITTAVPG